MDGSCFPVIEQPQARIGVGVMVLCQQSVVLLKRRGSHGAGEWSFPGGHLEFGELVFDCARREVFEELGVSLDWCNNDGIFTEDFFPGKHYITLYCYGRTMQTPRIMEPNKASDIMFVRDFHALPEPLFSGVSHAWKELFHRF
jgi:8-oxo-dGTP diphosphatase